MAASHWVFLSPNTYNLAWSFFSWEVTRGQLPWYPPYLHFAHIHLLIARIAHNRHLPSIFIIAYPQVK